MSNNLLSWASSDGSFKRQSSQFREFIRQDGKFKSESGRYLLYVSYACPWVFFICFRRIELSYFIH